MFVVPNRHSKVLGVTVVEQGEFLLQRRVFADEADSLNGRLDKVSYLQPNEWFASGDAIREHLAAVRSEGANFNIKPLT